MFGAPSGYGTGVKEGGQALLGGLDCTVHRNFFGAQINSFETQLPAPTCLGSDGCEADAAAADTFRAMFIRAPAVLEAGPEVEVLARYELTPEERQAQQRDSVIVAVREGPRMATAFHPELTSDTRWVGGPAEGGAVWSSQVGALWQIWQTRSDTRGAAAVQRGAVRLVARSKVGKQRTGADH